MSSIHSKGIYKFSSFCNSNIFAWTWCVTVRSVGEHRSAALGGRGAELASGRAVLRENACHLEVLVIKSTPCLCGERAPPPGARTAVRSTLPTSSCYISNALLREGLLAWHLIAFHVWCHINGSQYSTKVNEEVSLLQRLTPVEFWRICTLFSTPIHFYKD